MHVLNTTGMSVSVRKDLNNTITLDSTTDTDIIECSVELIGGDRDFLKTPRTKLLRKCTSATKNEVINLKGFQFRNESLQRKSNSNERINASLRSSLRRSFKLKDSDKSLQDTDKNLKVTPKRNSNENSKVNSAAEKLLSSIKKTPDIPYLSRTKLQNVEKWLIQNDFNVVQTPPSICRGTPVSLRRKNSIPLTTNTKQVRRRRLCSDESSVDSEVKKVLEAVYGEDWRAKNVHKKSKTEPKRTKKTFSTNKTDYKSRARGLLDGKPIKSVRRKILNNEIRQSLRIDDRKTDALNSSFSSGIKVLNESESEDELIIRKGLTSGKRKKNDDASSSDSWKPQSVKKKTNTAKKSPSQGKRTRTPGTGETPVTRSGKTPTKTFLASLSVSTPKSRCHPEAQDFKINFKTKKEELAKKLFKLYNSEIFGNGLPDDMDFSWNVKLRGTAGFCHNKKITKSTGQIIRLSRIEFSTKIIDRADRLRDTLIHELCHAASWVIDGVLDGHGSVWSKWACKSMKRFPELPPIRRCHNYEIASKYTYRCTGCGYSINRHSKSINIERKRCGYCYGVLELFVNKKKRGKGEVPEFDSTRTLPAPNNFALFVKENYHNVKNSNSNAKHAEIMKILSQKYALTKKSDETPSGKK